LYFLITSQAYFQTHFIDNASAPSIY